MVLQFSYLQKMEDHFYVIIHYLTLLDKIRNDCNLDSLTITSKQ